MAREQLKNFATSALSGSITSSSTTINLTGGTGSSFPAVGNFVIVIDTELILIASRATDALTVAASGRGWDGSTAAAHSSAATVQLPVCAYNINHIWSNLADTFLPDVPPAQTPLSSSGVPSGSPSAFDNEFESQGSWTLFPTSLPTGATFNAGTTVKSHLLMARGSSSDNTLYTAYVAFAPGATAWTATCKMSDSMNSINLGGQIVEFHFLVTDQSNPTGTSDPGNAMRIDVTHTATVTSGSITGVRQVRPAKDVSNAFSTIAPSITVPWTTPLYLRMNNDGAGRFQLFFGDGITYTLLVDQTFSFTIAALALQYFSSGTNTNASHIVLVDWVRVVTGVRLQYWG
jgi:hypothetical protein